MEKKQIEDMIAMYKEDIETVRSYWDEIPLERLSDVYLRLADSSEEIGIYFLLLGNKQEALNWFKKAAEYNKNGNRNQSNL